MIILERETHFTQGPQGHTGFIHQMLLIRFDIRLFCRRLHIENHFQRYILRYGSRLEIVIKSKSQLRFRIRNRRWMDIAHLLQRSIDPDDGSPKLCLSTKKAALPFESFGICKSDGGFHSQSILADIPNLFAIDQRGNPLLGYQRLSHAISIAIIKIPRILFVPRMFQDFAFTITIHFDGWIKMKLCHLFHLRFFDRTTVLPVPRRNHKNAMHL